jgi:hypothetical protein
VSKAIDKAAGAEREVVGRSHHPQYNYARETAVFSTERRGYDDGTTAGTGDAGDITAPATPEAEQWAGWGTALKPAHEPIVVARKPLSGTVAACVLAHGTGALNVDGCRIAGDVPSTTQGQSTRAGEVYGADQRNQREFIPSTAGRWPANVVLDETAAAMLDAQTGTLQSGSRAEGVRKGLGYHGANGDGGPAINGNSGGASRFLYVAKASSAERNAGLDGFEDVASRRYGERGAGELLQQTPQGDVHHRNVHPTVKPISLCRWMVRLVTPPGGTVLDPFAGSGTTLVAATVEGFDSIGIEQDAEYVAIAGARVAWWARHPDGMTLVKRLEAEKERTAVEDAGQGALFDLEPAADAASRAPGRRRS